MKKLIILFVLICSCFTLNACGSPMIEVATSNHHIEGGIEGITSLWNAMYKDDKVFKYGNEKETDFISYVMTPAAFVINIKKEVPEDAPSGIQMLCMAPKDAVFIKVYSDEADDGEVLDNVEIANRTAGLFEARSAVGRVVFVLEFLGVDTNDDGVIEGEELREPKSNFKSTVAFYDAEGKKLDQESFDVVVKQEF
ncbi:MAG: hypothetical protein WCR30_02285 [Clostridia bacterium]